MPVSIKCAKRIQLATAAVHYASRFMNIQYLIRGFLSPRDAYSPFPPPPLPPFSRFLTIWQRCSGKIQLKFERQGEEGEGILYANEPSCHMGKRTLMWADVATLRG